MALQLKKTSLTASGLLLLWWLIFLQVNKPNLPLASGEFSVATGIALVTTFAAVVCESKLSIPFIIIPRSLPFSITASLTTGIIQLMRFSYTRSCDLLVVVWLIDSWSWLVLAECCNGSVCRITSIALGSLGQLRFGHGILSWCKSIIDLIP